MRQNISEKNDSKISERGKNELTIAIDECDINEASGTEERVVSLRDGPA
jgi:hypothetical protein